MISSRAVRRPSSRVTSAVMPSALASDNPSKPASTVVSRRAMTPTARPSRATRRVTAAPMPGPTPTMIAPATGVLLSTVGDDSRMNGARSHPRNRRSRFSGKRPTEQTGELTGLCVAGEVDPGAVVELRRRAAHTDRVLAGGDRPLAPGLGRVVDARRGGRRGLRGDAGRHPRVPVGERAGPERELNSCGAAGCERDLAERAELLGWLAGARWILHVALDD